MRALKVVLVLLVLFAGGCGGGGGGGGDDPIKPPADVAYSGIRTQAYIDSNNAEPLVLGAYGGVDISAISPLGTVSSSSVESTATINNPFKLSIVFNHVANLVKPNDQIMLQSMLDPAQECLNYPAGSLTDNLVESTNDSTSTISGSISYINCDIGGVILNGSVNLAASINLTTDDFTLSMTMNPIAYNDGSMSYTLIGDLSGSMVTNVSGFLVSHLALNITLDDLSGHTYWLNDYVIDETEEISGLRSIISGRFYENDYGFVDFVTDQVNTIFIPYNPLDSTYDGRIDYTGSSGSHATLWLGVNQSDYCINVFNSSGVVDIGTCAL